MEIINEITITELLDEYLDALNRLDLLAHLKTLHFPHFRYTKDLRIFENPSDMMPYFAAPDSVKKEYLRKVLGAEWDHTKWIKRKIIQTDLTKAHVATTFARFNLDGRKIAEIESLYILTYEEDKWDFQGNKWAIKGRSSFAGAL